MSFTNSVYSKRPSGVIKSIPGAVASDMNSSNSLSVNLIQEMGRKEFKHSARNELKPHEVMKKNCASESLKIWWNK